MTYQKKLAMLLFVPLTMLGACTQTTPSMMNASPIVVAEETIIDQVLLQDIDNRTVENIASYYKKNASGPLGVTVTYNPNSKSFNRYHATKEANRLANNLRKEGVQTVLVETAAVPYADPTVILNYETTVALAPADCGSTPGLKDYQTGRFLGDYKFGCGVESMFVQQIADPTDLYGKSDMGKRYARRDGNVLEGYASGAELQPLEGVETNERIGN